MGLAENLKTARELLGKSQKDMAKAIGISLTAWQNYESGSQVPGGKVFKSFVDLEINTNWLLTGEGEMKRGAEKPSIVAEEFKSYRLERGLAKQLPEEPKQIDPVMAVIKQELLRMTLDQKRAVLKLCMDITGEQYALVKHSSQSNREQRLNKGILKEDPAQADTEEVEEWEMTW